MARISDRDLDAGLRPRSPDAPGAGGSLKTIVDASVTATKPKFTEIDPSRLQRFLQSRPDVAGPVELSGVRGGGAGAGASSGIVVFDAQIADARQAYVLRYAPMNHEGRIFAEYDVAGQFELQRRLHAGGLPVPNGRWLDASGEHLGLPSFVMDKVEGEVADGSPYTGGLIAEAADSEREALLGEVLFSLRRVHAVDWRGLQLEACVRKGGGRTPLERYLNWFWKTAEWVQPASLERLQSVRKWLFDNQPTYHPDDYSLVHGDPGLGNYMFRDGEVVSIIDWELAGILYPTYDIAMQCSINDYFRAAATPEIAQKIPTAADWIGRYERVSSARVKDFEFYRKAVCIPSLVVSLSMHRNMPDDLKAAHLDMMETTWAVAEAR